MTRDDENHERFEALQGDGIPPDSAAWIADLDQRLRELEPTVCDDCGAPATRPRGAA